MEKIRSMPWILRLGVLLGTSLVIAELLLQLAASFARNRATVPGHGTTVRIIAVGDSHVFGAMVEDDESFPAQLQKLLSEQAPGRYSVVNLGLPGLNTSQVRNRLAANVAFYQPDIVIIWCGINNKWNRSEIDSRQGWATWLHAVSYRSRLLRLVRVWLHNRTIDRGVRSLIDEANTCPAKFNGKKGQWTVYHRGQPEIIGSEFWETTPAFEVIQNQAYSDFKSMNAWLRSAGVRTVFVGYPVPWREFAAVNLAMQRVSEEDKALFVPTATARKRASPSERQLLPGAHPRAGVYREIAREVLPLILEIGGGCSGNCRGLGLD